MDVFTLTSALSAIKDRLLTYNTSINKAFQRIDLDNSGSVSQPVGKVESGSVGPQLAPLACLSESSSLRCALGTSRRAAQGICSAAARPGRCRRIQQPSIHTQVNVEEMLHCFKDAHIEHIVNANTLDLIMSYCDATGDGETNCNELTLYLLYTHALTTCLLCTGEIDYNELASLIMTGDILGRGSWLRAASGQRHSSAAPASSDGLPSYRKIGRG